MALEEGQGQGESDEVRGRPSAPHTASFEYRMSSIGDLRADGHMLDRGSLTSSLGVLERKVGTDEPWA